jgi:adenylate cyclase
LISILISLELRRLFQTALMKSSQSMNEIAEGNFGLRLPHAGENEIGTLLASINKLAEGLADRERFRNIFGKYISSKVSEKILAAGDTKLCGELKKVALLMTDVKGFSAVSEKVPPAHLVHLLNHDFEKLVAVVEAEEGIIDKFIGDACLSYFDPVSCDKPASAALRSARRLLQETDLEFEIGIGLHFGEVIAGNIGSPKRLEYTVIGDAVNTLARVESQTRVFSKQIILTDEFREVLISEGAQFEFDDLGLVSLKGKTKPVRLWAV